MELKFDPNDHTITVIAETENTEYFRLRAIEAMQTGDIPLAMRLLIVRRIYQLTH